MRWNARQAPRHRNRDAQRPKCDGRSIGNQAQPGGVQGIEAQANQQRRRNRYGRTKPCRALQKGTEAKANQHHQQALFGRLNQFWIGAAFIEAMRRIQYFPHLSAAQPLGVILGWLVFGVLCVLAGMAIERLRRAIPAQREPLNESTRLELEEDVAV